MSERSKNKAVITGLLYKVSPRKTTSGKDVAGFIVAVLEGKAKHHINCLAWQGLAQRVTIMALGSKVYVSGKLQCDSWTASDGTKRYKTEIVADTVEEIASLHSSPSPEALAKRPIDDSDIPF